MKRNILFLLFIMLTGGVIFYSSCKKSDSSDNNNNNNGPRTDTLHVLVHAGAGNYIGNADVKLYTTSHDRDVDSNVKYKSKTDVTSPSKKGAVFYNIPAVLYYVKVSFMIGGDYYEGTSQISVPANTTIPCDVAATKTLANGNLRVFVQYNTQIFSDAEVNLFLSDSDRTDSNVYLHETTSDNGSAGVFALFQNLPFRKYYIKAKYHDPGTGSNYMGTESGGTGIIVPKGTTISTHILTTKL